MSETVTTVQLPAAFASYFDQRTNRLDLTDEADAELLRIYQAANRPSGNLVLRFPQTMLGFDALSNLIYYIENGAYSCNDGPDGDEERRVCGEAMKVAEAAHLELALLVD